MAIPLSVKNLYANISYTQLLLLNRILFHKLTHINKVSCGELKLGHTPGHINVMGKHGSATFEYQIYRFPPPDLDPICPYRGWIYRPATAPMETPDIWREYLVFVYDAPIDYPLEERYNEFRKSRKQEST